MSDEQVSKAAMVPVGVRDCAHGDPGCPCRDGDLCHYEDGDAKDPALPCPFTNCTVERVHARWRDGQVIFR